jgi:hypothetical protein
VKTKLDGKNIPKVNSLTHSGRYNLSLADALSSILLVTRSCDAFKVTKSLH